MDKPVLVLGMHKSGTTLVAEMLHHSGIKMIEDDKAGGYDEGNKYERLSTNLFHKKLLRCENIKSIYLRDILDASSVEPDLWREGREIISSIQSRNKDWGFKEPRTLLAFDFWREVLPEFRVLCVFRDPVIVHKHYTKKKTKFSGKGVAALRAYAAYNRKMIQVLESKNIDGLAIEYSELMQGDKEIRKIEKFLNRKMVDRRNRNLYRSRGDKTCSYKLAAFVAKHAFGADAERIFSKLQDLRAVQS